MGVVNPLEPKATPMPPLSQRLALAVFVTGPPMALWALMMFGVAYQVLNPPRPTGGFNYQPPRYARP